MTSRQDQQLRLNVASGRYPIDGFVNVDGSLFLRLAKIYPLIKVFLSHRHRKPIEEYRAAMKRGTYRIHNCLRPLPYPEQSVDHILCSHFLEHVYRDQAERICANFFRVLKPDGTLHVIVPDLRAQVNSYNDGKRDADEFLDYSILSQPKRPSLIFRCFEVTGAFGFQHRWMYDRCSLVKLLAEAGFEVVSENNTASREHRAGDPGDVNIALKKSAGGTR